MRITKLYFATYIFLLWSMPLFCMQYPNMSKKIEIHNSRFQDLICSYCQNEFSSKSSRKRHELTCSTRTGFWCKGCNITFQNFEQLSFHQKQCISFQALLCNMCNRIFASKKAKQTHQRNCKQRIGLWCKGCDKDFFNSIELSNHQEACSRFQDLKCRHCLTIFASKYKKNKHEQSCQKRKLLYATNQSNPIEKISPTECQKNLQTNPHQREKAQTFSGYKRIRPQGCNDDHENQFKKKRRRKNTETKVPDTSGHEFDENPEIKLDKDLEIELDEALEMAIASFKMENSFMQ